MNLLFIESHFLKRYLHSLATTYGPGNTGAQLWAGQLLKCFPIDIDNDNDIACSDDHTVVGVAARDRGRAQEFAKRHGIPKVYDSYKDLIEDDQVQVDN